MNFLYNFAIGFYLSVIKLASCFNLKARTWVRGRKDIFEKLQSVIPANSDIIWFHCASLGEFEQGRPVMEEIKKRSPHLKILISFFSPSGFEVRKDYQGADFIFYLPADTKSNAKKWIDIIRPKFVVFIKYEFWYNYIQELAKAKIPVFLISGNFRSTQIFFRWYGKWFANLLKTFSHFFVQDKISLELLSKLGIHQVTVSGDTRFDRVYEISKSSREIDIAEEFCKNHFVIVAGSTWPKDETMLTWYINQAPDHIKMIIAPHEIEESKLLQLSGNLKVKLTRFSQAGNYELVHTKVLIIDNIGMLSSLYKYASIAYIGGGFGAGIHNILEAATYGVPVIFGPNYYKFKEAADLINMGGAFSINSSHQLKNQIEKLAINNNLLKTSGNTGKTFVKSSLGATKIIVDKLLIF